MTNTTPLKTAVCSDFTPELNVFDSLSMIKHSGFDAVMLNYDSSTTGVDLDAQLAFCRQLQLPVCCAHLRAKGANDMWGDNDYFARLIEQDLYSCAKNGIQIAVLHMTETNVFPPPSQIGVERIEKLARIAQKLNVRLALENKRNSGHIEAVFQAVKSDALCFCYDTGHEALYFPQHDVIARLSRFYPMAICHLHDNHYKVDEHMIPGDGILDFDRILRDIKLCGYNGYVLLETRDRHSNAYTNVSHEEFLLKAHNKACEIALKLSR